MTVTGSLASPSVNPNPDLRKARASKAEVGIRQTIRGRVDASKASVQAVEVVEGSRPVSARRAVLLETASGQAMLRDARMDLGNALHVHGVSRVASLRLAAGLSQKELCTLTGLPQPHLSRLENGKVKAPDTQTLQTLATALNVSLETIFSAFASDIA